MNIKDYKEEMKLSVVIPVLNQHDLAKTCYAEIKKNTVGEVEFVIIDNGSTIPIKQDDFPSAKIVRNEVNTGVYPTFKQGMENTRGDVVAFLHSDVVVWEQAWNLRVVDRFLGNEILGMVGFIGSNEIDPSGGRGLGTSSNFQGKEIGAWKGSGWEQHGRHLTGYEKSAVVDGCVMILSRRAFNAIGYREDFPPHHFYDRLISTQLLERGFEICTLGIEFDHISGQTVNQEKDYQRMAHAWLRDNYGRVTWTAAVMPFQDSINYDDLVYMTAEKIWLDEYRDTKHIIPIKV